MRKRQRVLLVTVLAMVLLVAFAGTAWAQFADVEEHWAQAAIQRWLERDLVSGYPDGTFRPDSEVTRAEFITFVDRAFELPMRQGYTGFTDVQEGDWYYGHLVAAVQAGIIGGYPDGTFRPGASITRQEAASVLQRLLGLEETQILTFDDSDAIGSWARPAVKAVVSAGIMGGYPDGTFRPGAPITRAETLTVLDRSLPFVEPPPPVYAVTFEAEDEEETPLAEVLVRVYTDAARTPGSLVAPAVSTDADGVAGKELPDGQYWFTASLEGYETYRGDFTVAGEPKTVAFVMQKPDPVPWYDVGPGPDDPPTPRPPVDPDCVIVESPEKLRAAVRDVTVERICLTVEFIVEEYGSLRDLFDIEEEDIVPADPPAGLFGIMLDEGIIIIEIDGVEYDLTVGDDLRAVSEKVGDNAHLLLNGGLEVTLTHETEGTATKIYRII